jgi:3-hydroxyacyl-[acyl-carrier-protein] dehydratase
VPTDERTDELFGSAGVERLLPHRPPFRLVDAVVSYELEPEPALRAIRRVDPADPWHAGHFPARALVPGSVILEGLAQAAGVMLALSALHREAQRHGIDAAQVHRALAESQPSGEIESLLARLRSPTTVGALADASVRFREPVMPGAVLLYAVRLVRALGEVWRCDAQATVDSRTVASGYVTLATIRGPQ